jgi:hypothetical protein
MIDFVCVEEESIGEWGEVEIGKFGEGESDHGMVMVKWKGKVMRQGKKETMGGEERQRKKGGQKIGKLDVSKVRGNKWRKLEERGELMGEWRGWLEEEGKEAGIDAVYEKWIEQMKEVVEGGQEGEQETGRQEEWKVWGRDLERVRKEKIRARRRWVEMEEGERKDKAKEEWKEWRRKMKRLVRKKRVSDALGKMQRIERLGRKDPRKMWQEWKKWSKKEKKKEGTDEMVGEEGMVVRGEEIAAAWATVFKKVVVEMKGEYDEDLKEQVVHELRNMEEEKEDGDGRSVRYQDGSHLNEEVTEEEVEKVVQNMKNGKASGVDEVIAEVLKHGGEGMMTASFVLCRERFRRNG